MTIVVAAAVLAAPLAAFAASPDVRTGNTGSIGLRILDVPLAAREDPRAHIYIVDHLAPGTAIHRRIEVANTTGSSARVVLYAAAATIAKGSFLGAAGHAANDLSTWTTIQPGVVQVPSGGRAIATVTLDVPPDAAPGERYGVVWAEVRSAQVPGSGIVQVNRVGIRLYLSIGPGGAPASDFSIDSLTAERSSDGHPIVLATVHNTGGRALDMGGTLSLSDGPGGLSAGPFLATLGTTLGIGDIEPVRFALDTQIPSGPWDARITLRSGLLERSARAEITFPDTGTAAPVGTTSNPLPWRELVIVALVILLLMSVAALLMVLRRRPRPSAHVPGA